MATGSVTRCMEKESLHGLTEDSTKESTKTIKNTVMESSYGLMVENMMDYG